MIRRAARRNKRSSSLVSTILVVFVDRAAGPERVERESKRHIIRDIDKLTSHLPLGDHIADVSTSTNGCIIKRGHLPGLPSDQEIAVVDGAFRSQQSKRPSFMAAGHSLDRHHALHRVDAVGQRSIIEEGPSARRVVANIRIASIIARIWVAWDEHPACREAMSKSFERFQSRRNEPQLLSGKGTDNGFPGELLPPALSADRTSRGQRAAVFPLCRNRERARPQFDRTRAPHCTAGSWLRQQAYRPRHRL